MFVQFAFDDGVVIPEDESIFWCLVLRDTELCVHIVLHAVVVAVQVVGRNIHQHGNVGAELIHVIQLERTELNHVVIMLIRGHLQSKALANVACQSYIQTYTLENVINE